MRRHKHIAPLAALLLTLVPTAHAQEAAPTGAPASTSPIGQVELTYQKNAEYAGNQARVRGNVHLSSDIFAAQAETMTVDLLPRPKGKAGKGPGGPQSGAIGGIGRAAMEPLPGRQVSGEYTDIAQGRKYEFQADHAVYAADNSRPQGGRLDLTGHVRVAVNAPVALDGPLVTVTDHAQVLLGQGTEYPKVETEAGHLTFTPLNGGQ